MPFEIVRNDITTMKVDAIVNAANRSLLGGGGVDGAIHLAAGPKLLAKCRTLGGCETGEAKITKGYRLPAKYVIHTVGPVWHGGNEGEEALLDACYRNSLALAERYGCESVAFPLISAGTYGYPKDRAMAVAVGAISRFLLTHEMTVYLVVFGPTEFLAGRKLFRDVKEYIDDVYVETHVKRNVEYAREQLWRRDEAAALEYEKKLTLDEDLGAVRESAPEIAPMAAPKREEPASGAERRRPAKGFRAWMSPKPEKGSDSGAEQFAAPGVAQGRAYGSLVAPDWEKLLKQADAGFSESLLRLIDEKGMTDAECYKKANVDRKLFSKIRSNPDYRPSKPTVFAFAVALELSLIETQGLLRRAGFALSHSSRFDIILEYFIVHRNYNIYEINEVLFQFDMPLLGSGAAI